MHNSGGTPEWHRGQGATQLSLHCVNQVGLGEGGESLLSPEHSGQNLLPLDQHHTLGQDLLLLGRVYLENVAIPAFLGYPTLDYCPGCVCQAAPSCCDSTSLAGTEWGKGGLRGDVAMV